MVAWVLPGAEPTRHLMGDLRGLKVAFEAWGGSLTLVLPAGTDPAQLGPDFQDLPTGVKLVTDPEGRQLAAILGLKGCGAGFPVLLGMNGQGSLLFFSQGYRIGAGEQVLRSLATVK